MRASVRDAWPSFVSGWEGRVGHMYLDTLKYVTFGIGRKIEDNNAISEYGLTRPWRDSGGHLVLESAIRQEWATINGHTELASRGGYAFKSVAKLHLENADIDEALMDTTATFWAALLKTLPALEAWPADAQLALLDMAYHMGPNFLGSKWPNFTAAAKTADFGACATHCQTANRSPRDQGHAKLYGNAAAVWYADLNPDPLWGVGKAPTVASWTPSGAARTTISAAKVVAAKSNVFSAEAWYVQRMLMLAGTYTVKIDGLFGAMSRAAFTVWTKNAKQSATMNAATLAALSKATLRMAVTA